MLMKKFFVLYLISAYLFAICPTDVYAKEPKKKSQSKNNKKKKGNKKDKKPPQRKIRKQSSDIEDENNENEEEGEGENKETTSTTAGDETSKGDTKTPDGGNDTNTQQSSETAEGEETTEEEPAGPTEEELLNGVPADPAWEEFKFCMQQQCVGSPEQPNNVECYKSINFDNAFQSCKVMIPEMERHQLFKKYFTTIFLITEQEEACKTMYNGTWVKEKELCEIAVTYSRSYKSSAKFLKNNKVGCNDKKSKKYYLSAKKVQRIVCSHDTFGLSACYEDNPNQTANEMAMVSGMITTGAGLLGGVIGGIATAASASKTVKKTETIIDEDGKEKEVTKEISIYDKKTKEIIKDGKKEIVQLEETVLSKDEINAVKSKAAWEGVKAGIDMGAGMTIQGTQQMITAGVQSQDVGGEVPGRCSLPDGNVYQEGSVIELTY